MTELVSSERPVKAKAFSIEAALRYGWDATMAHLRPLLTLAVIGGVLAMIQSGLSEPGGRSFLRGLGSFAISILQLMLAMVWIRTALRLRRGQPADLTHWSEVLPLFWSFLICSVLFGVIVGVGLVLLIVPGVILGLMFGFWEFLVVDRSLDPFDAFRESQRLTHGTKGHLFLFVLALIGINLLGSLALGIGLLISIPVSFLAGAEVYRTLRIRAGEPAGPWTIRPAGPTEVHA